MADIDDDKSSRKEWVDQYTEGLKFLGMKFEDRTEPFEGASGVIHPLLAGVCDAVPSTSIQRIITCWWPC